MRGKAAACVEAAAAHPWEACAFEVRPCLHQACRKHGQKLLPHHTASAAVSLDECL